MLPSTPPSNENDLAQQRARQAKGLKAVIVFLLLSGVVIGFFVTGLPMPIRLMVAATDIILAAVLYLVLRQKFSGG